MEDSISIIIKRLRMKAGIFAEANYCGAWAVDTSGQKVATFHLIHGGDCWLHLDGTASKRLLPGDLVFFPQDSRHLIASTESITPDIVVNKPPEEDENLEHTSMLCGYFEFSSQASWPLLEALPPVIVLSGTVGSQTQLLIDLMLAECKQNAPGHDAVLDQLAYVLLIHTIRRSLEEGSATGLLLAISDSRIGEALNLIHREPQQPWQVESLAGSVGMSRAVFSNRFTRLVGQTVMAYLSSWRMQVAIDLLTSTDMGIAVVAEEVGYSSEAVFRNAFTKNIGIPPGRYRRDGAAGLRKDNSSVVVQ